MATTVISSIIADGSGDYTTLAAWYSAKAGNLVTADQIQVAECHGTLTANFTILNMSSGSSTTDATRYFIVRGAEGSKPLGNVHHNHFGISTIGNVSQFVISCAIPNTRFQDLLIRDCIMASAVGRVLDMSGNTNGLVERCVIRRCDSPVNNTLANVIYGIYVFLTIGVTIRNNIISGLFSQTGKGGKTVSCNVFGIWTQGISSLYNNTIHDIHARNRRDDDEAVVNRVAYGIRTTYLGDPVIRNNMIWDVRTSVNGSGAGSSVDLDYFSSTGTQDDDFQDYNISEDTTAPGANSFVSQTPSALVIDDVTDKVKPEPLPTGNAFDTGEDNSGDFTDDAQGITRRSNRWDIGAVERPPLVRVFGNTDILGNTDIF